VDERDHARRYRQIGGWPVHNDVAHNAWFDSRNPGNRIQSRQYRERCPL
jgi:hypothetical protein